MLVPGDAERIAAHLGVPVAEVERALVASPGCIVGDTRTQQMYRIGTVTPRRVDGACVFLSADLRCRVHAVAPFGCAYYDTHMSAEDGEARTLWALRQIVVSKEYAALRARLPAATSWKPRAY